jgi:flagellar motor protein MotB
MGTFADLMSLLMCFFVLLLSFAEMDVQKFKQIAGSMEKAFGVQNILEVKDIPKGTSVIAQEFRPGRPEPTPIDTIMQQTMDMTQTELDFQPGDADQAGGHDKSEEKLVGGDTQQEAQKQQQQEQSNADPGRCHRSGGAGPADHYPDPGKSGLPGGFRLPATPVLAGGAQGRGSAQGCARRDHHFGSHR